MPLHRRRRRYDDDRISKWARLGAVASAAGVTWIAFVALSFVAATVAFAGLETGPGERWWPLLPFIATVVAAVYSFGLGVLMIPIVFLATLRVTRPIAPIPLVIVALLGATFAALAAAIFLSSPQGPGHFQPDLFNAIVATYAIAGALSAVAGWSVLGLTRAFGSEGAPIPKSRKASDSLDWYAGPDE